MTSINFGFIDAIAREAEQKETNKGREKEYDPSQNFQSVTYGLVNGAESLRGIGRTIDTRIVKIILGKEKIQSYSTIQRFWNFLPEIIEKILEMLVMIMENYGLIGNEYAADGTSIEVPLEDPDGKWNYDSTEDEYYYGYGLAIVVDSKTELPLSAEFTRQKKLNSSVMEDIVSTAVDIKKPTELMADPEFDVVDLIEDLLDDKVLPIIPYNPRNSNEELPIEYRAEKIVDEQQDNVSLNTDELDKEYYSKRVSVERAIGKLKELDLEEPPILGKKHVKTWAYFVMIHRLLIALAKHENDDLDNNLRKITM